MIPTERLYSIAASENVEILWTAFGSGIQGIYISSSDLRCPVIGLDHSLATDERNLRCVLAHELGHHFRSSGSAIIAPHTASNLHSEGRREREATDWALDLLIPTDSFLMKLGTGTDLLSLADLYYVLPKLIVMKARQLHRRGLHQLMNV